MSKPFFFRIESADLLNFATDPEGEGMSLLKFAKELQRGSSDIPFIQSVIDETLEFSQKKRNAANKRWSKVDVQTDAVHSGAMPEAVTEAVTETKPLKTVSRFSPPKLEEVKAYCRKRNKGIDAEKWIDHYLSNGWMVGKNKMKDWKAAVRTWERNTFNSGQPTDNSPSLPRFQP